VGFDVAINGFQVIKRRRRFAMGDNNGFDLLFRIRFKFFGQTVGDRAVAPLSGYCFDLETISLTTSLTKLAVTPNQDAISWTEKLIISASTAPVPLTVSISTSLSVCSHLGVTSAIRLLNSLPVTNWSAG